VSHRRLAEAIVWTHFLKIAKVNFDTYKWRFFDPSHKNTGLGLRMTMNVLRKGILLNNKQ